MKFISSGSSGGCLFFAMFCGYGFLASGEFSGAKEMWWKVGYGTVGGLSLLNAIWLAWRRR